MILIKYILFALVAIFLNLFTQYFIDYLNFSQYQTFISLALGTFTGLITKYFLDKKYIFYYKTMHLGDDIKSFILYSIMGLVTTAIFWGSELFFYYSFNFAYAKFIGGFIGLCIGYIVKYQLDKKFVFNKKNQGEL